jgi:Zn-dependent peptidase ImmA (M78 family)
MRDGGVTPGWRPIRKLVASRLIVFFCSLHLSYRGNGEVEVGGAGVDSMDATRWVELVEEAVGRCLERAGWLSPPVSAVDIAIRLGITIVRDRRLPTRGRCTRLDAQPLIAVAPEDRPERTEWTVAHELGEILFPELVASRPDLAQELAGNLGLREQVANLFATRLLLPTPWFLEAWLDTGGELLALKERFPSASHELIAFRMLDARPHMVISIFDQGRLTRRRASGGLGRPPLHPLENSLFQRLCLRRDPTHIAAEGITVDGWPVDEPGWHRDIIRLMADGD